MSTKPKSSSKPNSFTNNSQTSAGAERAASPACNYDAARIFMFEAYALKLRARVAMASGC